jgi:serine/threonine protein kinase
MQVREKERELKCNYDKCPYIGSKTSQEKIISSNKYRNNLITRQFTCRCCKLTFCSDNCLVEHLVIKEKEKKSSQNMGNQVSTANMNNRDLPNNIKSMFIKPGMVLKCLEKKSYFNFENFEKVLNKKGKVQILGTGAFGEVYLSKNKLDGKFYAIKQMDKERLTSVGIKPENIFREINIHIKLLHDHIVRLFSYHEDQKSYYLIIEYLEGGTLFSRIQKTQGLSEEESFKYFIQVASALNFLHENNFIHRDLKPENCLIDLNGDVKICDFGWTVESNQSRVTFCGTYEYMAPEIIKETPYTTSIDVWSLGILLYELLHSYSPFRAQSQHEHKYDNTNYDPSVEVLKNILKHKLKIEKKISDDCKDLLIKLLNPKMEGRMTVQQIFSHPWVTKFEARLKENFVSIENNIKQLNIKNSHTTQENTQDVTVLDTLTIVKDKATDDLFNNVLDQMQSKKKRNVRKSKSQIYNRFSIENIYKSIEEEVKKNKIVLRMEKNEVPNPIEDQVPYGGDTRTGLTLQMSPIRKNLVSYDDSNFSMLREVKEFDKEIDRNIEEKYRRLESLWKKSEKIKEELNKHEEKFKNKSNKNKFQLNQNEEDDLELDTNEFSTNKGNNYNENLKYIENSKNQQKILISDIPNKANTPGNYFNRSDDNKFKNNLEHNIKPVKSKNNNLVIDNYNDEIYRDSDIRASKYKKITVEKNLCNSGKKTLKKINQEMEALCNTKELNNSDTIQIEVSRNSKENHILNENVKIPFRFLYKDELTSPEKQVPKTPETFWNKIFGFLGGTFKCGN